ncbi:hypothetical protein PVAP13_5KG300407 [Panicum virgatum]|uniref:Uncharacterized protein n=1 Tax=Panicum virgatum TaxID=38727 RepID=A0A8T0SP80_PANVG|nr:hypothetical protein PVAP13_5KG300407 [Panicum virgatum]
MQETYNLLLLQSVVLPLPPSLLFNFFSSDHTPACSKARTALISSLSTMDIFFLFRNADTSATTRAAIGGRCTGGDESGGRLRSGRRHGKFLEQQLGADLDEGRQGPLLLEEEAQGVEALGEAAEHVHGEDAVGNGLAELDERVGEGLHAPAVVGDGESALTQRAKLGVDDLHACLAVADELLFKRNPRGVGRRSGGGDDLEELGADALTGQRGRAEHHGGQQHLRRLEKEERGTIGVGAAAAGEGLEDRAEHPNSVIVLERRHVPARRALQHRSDDDLEGGHLGDAVVDDLEGSRGHAALGAVDFGDLYPAERGRHGADLEGQLLAGALVLREAREASVALVGAPDEVADRGVAQARGVRVVEAAVLHIEQDDEEALDRRGLGVAQGLRPREVRWGDDVVEHAVGPAGVGLVTELGGPERVRGVEEEGLRREQPAEARARAGEADVAGGGRGGGGEEKAGEGTRV